jgi:hypothetical protein
MKAAKIAHRLHPQNFELPMSTFALFPEQWAILKEKRLYYKEQNEGSWSHSCRSSNIYRCTQFPFVHDEPTALAFKTLIQFGAAGQKSHLHSLGTQHDGVRFTTVLQRPSPSPITKWSLTAELRTTNAILHHNADWWNPTKWPSKIMHANVLKT